MVHVPLDWKKIDWMPDEKWSATLTKLEAKGIEESDLKRSVYVIRLNGNHCIAYPGGTSPTVYVGEGNFKQRINAHKYWLSEMQELVGNFKFQVCIAVPRVKNCKNAYKDAEAAILNYFKSQFSVSPLWNKQLEKCKYSHDYSEKQINEAIRKRSGAKYNWAITPMKSSLFYYYWNSKLRV